MRRLRLAMGSTGGTISHSTFMSAANQDSYQCDVLPVPPRMTQDSLSPDPLDDEIDPPLVSDALRHPSPPPAAQRKLCVRHQRMADEGTSNKLQQALDALPVEERETVSTIWSSFSSSPHPRRELILRGILTMCCFSQLSLLTEQLSHLIRIDPFVVLPREISLKILACLDAVSLCRAAQVSRRWRCLADDDVIWRGICEQHIGQRCLKCGWGLPLLERRRNPCFPSTSPHVSPSPPALKRENTDDAIASEPNKRHRTHTDTRSQETVHPSPPSSLPQSTSASDLLLSPAQPSCSRALTRPWKDVYSERLTIERNWRRGRHRVRVLSGHTDGVMCLQFSETMSHPSFPILISGSYDRTVRVWNLESGTEVRCLRGHTRAVRCLQFDEAKLITGSMDHTIRVWDWRKGECVRTLEGHTDGVVCLNFDAHVLASGSVDSAVRVWNLSTGNTFTLRGHREWINAVKLWDVPAPAGAPVDSSASSLQIQPGKMLFSASDDCTIRLWDLARRTCVRQFSGHVGQVQSLRLLEVDEGGEEDENAHTPQPVHVFENHSSEVPDVGDSPSSTDSCMMAVHDGIEHSPIANEPVVHEPRARNSGARVKKPVLISGSLDNTIKIWDVETGKTTKTLFGHIEGVWAVAGNKLRLVSGSHDRTIKIWNREEGRCTGTLSRHRGAVTCIALGDDKIVSGSDDGDIRIWSFSG